MNIRTLADFNTYQNALVGELNDLLHQADDLTNLDLHQLQEEAAELANIIKDNTLSIEQKQDRLKNSSFYPLTANQHPKNTVQDLFSKMIRLADTAEKLGRYDLLLKKKTKKEPGRFKTLAEVELTDADIVNLEPLGADERTEFLNEIFKKSNLENLSDASILWKTSFVFYTISEPLILIGHSEDDPSNTIRNASSHVNNFIAMLNFSKDQEEDYKQAEIHHNISTSIPHSAKPIELLQAVYSSKDAMENSFSCARLGEFIHETYHDMSPEEPLEKYLAGKVCQALNLNKRNADYQADSIKVFLAHAIHMPLPAASMTHLYTTSVATAKLLAAKDVSAEAKTILPDISEDAAFVLRLQTDLPPMQLVSSKEISDNIEQDYEEPEEEKANLPAAPEPHVLEINSDNVYHAMQYMQQRLIPQRLERKAILSQVMDINDIQSNSTVITEKAHEIASTLKEIYESFYALRVPNQRQVDDLKVQYNKTIDQGTAALGKENKFIKAVKFMSGVLAMMTVIGAIAEAGSHIYRGKSLFFESSARDKIVTQFEKTKHNADSLLSKDSVRRLEGRVLVVKTFL